MMMTMIMAMIIIYKNKNKQKEFNTRSDVAMISLSSDKIKY